MIDIPYRLYQRICTVVSRTNTRHTQLQDLKNYTFTGDYPQALIANKFPPLLKFNTQEYKQPRLNKEENVKILPSISIQQPI